MRIQTDTQREMRKGYDKRRKDEREDWMRVGRTPEVILGHELETILHDVIVRLRMVDKAFCKKCSKKATIKTAERLLNSQYEKVTDLLTGRVMHDEDE